ncbi:hypothetical protein FGRMN_1413 [Fusarium graminum]|nr:hypothetical protein FGRMN_1413 [Fusarium graminum]
MIAPPCRRIYAGASQVVVWLGQGTQASQTALTYISNSTDKPGHGSWVSGGLDFFDEPHKTDHFEQDLACLTSLLERPWFRRLWVLQEVVHSQRVLVMAGNQTVSWDALAESVQKLYRSGLILGKSSEKARVGAAAVIEMESIRRSQLLPDLLSILVATNPDECSDPRDKMYAVLNLANDYDPESDVEVLGPNYSLDPSETFTRFARWCVKRGNIHFLSCTTRAEGGETETRFPSWVPDWENLDVGHLFARYLDRIPFRADFGLELLPHDRPHTTVDNELVLFGAVVGKLNHDGPLSTFSKSNMDANAAELVDTVLGNKVWLDECQRISGIIPGSSERLWRTVTGTLTGAGYGATDDSGQRFHRYREMLDSISQFADAGQKIPTSAITHYASQKHLSASIESSILMWASKRRFALTDSGMMALVPSRTKPGDILAVVAGSRVPLVFREIPGAAGKYHTVVGEAFLDDVMDGEWVRRHVEDYMRLGKGHKRPLLKYFLLN